MICYCTVAHDGFVVMHGMCLWHCRDRLRLDQEKQQTESDIKTRSADLVTLQRELETLVATAKKLDAQRIDAKKRLDELGKAVRYFYEQVCSVCCNWVCIHQFFAEQIWSNMVLLEIFAHVTCSAPIINCAVTAAIHKPDWKQPL